MNKRILAVDDEEDVLFFIRYIFEGRGYEVVTAENGKLALAEAQKAKDEGRPFDLYLSDFNMPGMSGGQFKEAIQASGLNGSTPFVFLTALSKNEKQQITEKYKPTAIVEKPFDRDQLADIIENCLAQPTPDITSSLSNI